MELKISSAVSEANEPLLKAVGSGLEKYIFRYLNYPETGGDASEIALIKKLAIAAREVTEKYVNRALAEQTLIVSYLYDELKRQNWKVALPYGPVSSITSVVAVYNDKSTTNITDYQKYGRQYVDIEIPNIISTGTSKVSYYSVTAVVGYGAPDCDTIPDGIVSIMAEMCAKWYSNRGTGENILDYETKKKLNAFTRVPWI